MNIGAIEEDMGTFVMIKDTWFTFLSRVPIRVRLDLLDVDWIPGGVMKVPKEILERIGLPSGGKIIFLDDGRGGFWLLSNDLGQLEESIHAVAPTETEDGPRDVQINRGVASGAPPSSGGGYVH